MKLSLSISLKKKVFSMQHRGQLALGGRDTTKGSVVRQREVDSPRAFLSICSASGRQSWRGSTESGFLSPRQERRPVRSLAED